MIERHYKASELADRLNCNPETLRRAAARGELRSVRIGSDRRFPESAVIEWLERDPQTSTVRGRPRNKRRR